MNHKFWTNIAAGNVIRTLSPAAVDAGLLAIEQEIDRLQRKAAAVRLARAAIAADCAMRDSAWTAVCREYVAMTGEIDEDDAGMVNASNAELRDWADDQESRIGHDVTRFRAAIEHFVKARDIAAGRS